jgi:hypothetical protein
MRESKRISKCFESEEVLVEGLKSCLKSKRDAGQKKQKVTFREYIYTFKEGSKIKCSASENCFWSEDEMAEFRYEASMEECGWDNNSF